MTAQQLSHVPGITEHEEKTSFSKHCYSKGVKNQVPFRAQALSLWNASGFFWD